MVVLATRSCELERTRRTSGKPVSATSIGIAIAVSSSSAPIDAFCTMTLKTGAERSGNTSRRRSFNHTAPITDPASTSSNATTGFANERVMIFAMNEGSLVVRMIASAFGFLRFRLQQERAIDDDRLAGLQACQHFDFALQIASAPDVADLERPLALRHEHHPLISHALHRRH